MGTLASQAEIGDLVQAPGTLLLEVSPLGKNCETVYEKYCNIVKVKVNFCIAYCYETIIFQYAIVTNRAGVQLRGFWVGKWFPCNAVRIMRY